MKLLTHNMLQCHIKGVQNGYPFKVEAEKVRWEGRCHNEWSIAPKLASSALPADPG